MCRAVTDKVTELHSSTMFSEESCSVGLSEKMGFQLGSELLATVCGERRSGGSAFQTTGAAMEKNVFNLQGRGGQAKPPKYAPAKKIISISIESLLLVILTSCCPCLAVR